MRVTYDPAATFELKVSEVEFRRTDKGRQLMARIYQPQGSGPFPTVLDLHGGAWRRKDRLAEEPMNRAIAASGVLVVAIDMRLSDEAPYPASVQDANYGVRWLKWKATDWNGDPSKIANTQEFTNSAMTDVVTAARTMFPGGRITNADLNMAKISQGLSTDQQKEVIQEAVRIAHDRALAAIDAHNDKVQRFDKQGRVVRVDHKKNVAVVSVGLGQWEVPLEEVFPLV